MQLTNRIADELTRICGEDTVIYTENQDNNFVEPCFYICKVSTVVSPRLCENQNRTYTYQVVYFANGERPNADLDRVEGLLLDNFVKLPEFAYIRNREFDTDYTEKTLSLVFEITINAHKLVDETMLGEVKTNAETKLK